MSTMTFATAVKRRTWARIALISTPGGGATRTALTMAKALGGTIGVIDAERGRAQLWANMFGFQHLNMSQFAPDDLTRAVITAAMKGIDVLIIDTVSPFWNGADGVRDRVDQAASSFDGWRRMRPIERRMWDAILMFPGHVIVNVRPKVDYLPAVDGQGRPVTQRVGVKPDQRDGMERDFTLVADLNDRVLRVVKSSCPALVDHVETNPKGDVAVTLRDWLDDGATGELLNPVMIADWAMDPDVTADELAAAGQQLAEAGLADAVTTNPYRTGSNADVEEDEFARVGMLLRRRWSEAAKFEAAQNAAELHRQPVAA